MTKHTEFCFFLGQKFNKLQFFDFHLQISLTSTMNNELIISSLFQKSFEKIFSWNFVHKFSKNAWTFKNFSIFFINGNSSQYKWHGGQKVVIIQGSENYRDTICKSQIRSWPVWLVFPAPAFYLCNTVLIISI